MKHTTDWPRIIEQIVDAGGTLVGIAAECGFASAGAVHGLKSGRSPTCTHERGVALLAMHKRLMRRKGSAK